MESPKQRSRRGKSLASTASWPPLRAILICRRDPFSNRTHSWLRRRPSMIKSFRTPELAKLGRRLSIYSPSNLRARRRRCPWRNRVMYWISHISLRQHAILYRQVVTRANRSQTPKQDSPRESEGGGSGKCRDRSYRSKASVIGEGTGCKQPKNFPGSQRATCRFARPPCRC